MLKTIREVLIAKLEELKSTKFKAVEPYAGQLSEGANFALRMPAALLTFEGMQFEIVSHQTYRLKITYQVWIFSKLKRNEIRNLDKIEDLVDDTIEKLLELNPVEIREVVQVYNDDNLIVYGIKFNYDPTEVLNV